MRSIVATYQIMHRGVSRRVELREGPDITPPKIEASGTISAHVLACASSVLSLLGDDPPDATPEYLRPASPFTNRAYRPIRWRKAQTTHERK